MRKTQHTCKNWWVATLISLQHRTRHKVNEYEKYKQKLMSLKNGNKCIKRESKLKSEVLTESFNNDCYTGTRQISLLMQCDWMTK